MWLLKAVPQDPDHPLTFRLLPGHLRSIGRGAGATFIVDAPLISRVHCRLTVAEDSTVEVTDLESTNGTWIDGKPITTATFQEGQVLRVGRVEFVLEREAAPPEVLLETRAVAPFFKNGFLVASGRSRDAVLIDPGDEVSQLIETVKAWDYQVKAILLTHAHMDHVSGVEAARRATGAPVAVHRDDLFLYESAQEQGRMFGMALEQPSAPDLWLTDGQRLEFDGFAVTVHHTPGHSPGGICLAVGPMSSGEDELFVGDTLFAGSIGRTDLPGGHYPTLMESIRTRLFAFPDEAVVHPGHGPSTTVGAERRSNPFLKD